MSKWTHCHQNVRLLLGLYDVNLKQREAVACSFFHKPIEKKSLAGQRHNHKSGETNWQEHSYNQTCRCVFCPGAVSCIDLKWMKHTSPDELHSNFTTVGKVCIHYLVSHLQDIIQGLWAEGPARVEQIVARLLHLMLLPPWRLSIPRLRPFQALAAALKLLAHILEVANISGRRDLEKSL